MIKIFNALIIVDFIQVLLTYQWQLTFCTADVSFFSLDSEN